MRGAAKWMAIDATFIWWFFLAVSKETLHIIVHDDDALIVSTKITGLFTNNQLQLIVFLQQEFVGLHQNDSSIDDYCMRLKNLMDNMHDIGFPLSDEVLLSRIKTDLNKDIGNATSNLGLLTIPTYHKAVDYLSVEECQIKNSRAHTNHTSQNHASSFFFIISASAPLDCPVVLLPPG
ncbi:uncharacterized protein [Aegilops tauschii subsp. strangulata]|uniref:uncharacterized protein n=1 Tax=Aegilops tauschii subsp. strangulata TaxID=200361 RepID=UPI00098A7783|nr:uncharacterized protein LOC109774551 [Aegilops tauschii subsp. strangulata]